MCKTILQPKTRNCPHPRINILWGERAAEVFWEIRGVQSRSCLFDGRHAPKACMGESDALLVGFHSFLASQQDNRTLFLCDFLERLDESVDLHPIFDALIATGRQVFIALPHTYPIERINALEVNHYGATIHPL
jgi:hypothetical protein